MGDPMVEAYTAAYDAAIDRMWMGRRLGIAAALRVMADEIDRGPTFPLPPSVISALVRERADALEAS